MKIYTPLFAFLLLLTACSESPRTTHADSEKPAVSVQTIAAQMGACRKSTLPLALFMPAPNRNYPAKPWPVFSQ